ncbi:hypothetical protein KQI82_07530 [Oscillibacter sp. MSJ-2]|uniref:ABC transporter permease n=1 Tax=Dysosmobacter acutus TaxID=2841504 RepID=A0ABS6F8Z7_9FIRM|nr:hypothetical protein [Dysosmobacter acutus]
MGKVFWYELRRSIWNKGFLGITVVTIWYGWRLLTGTIILGVANTAPFSPWSFGAYLARLLPLLSVLLLFLLWNQSAERTRGLEVLSDAAPVRPGRYLLVKCGAAFTAWLVLAFAVSALGAGFLWALFGTDVPCARLLLPSLIALLPPALFWLGCGLTAGRIHPALLFVLMAAALTAAYLPRSVEWSLYAEPLFTEYPLSLSVLDPAFTMPAEALLVRLAYGTAGMALLGFAVARHQSRRERKS